MLVEEELSVYMARRLFYVDNLRGEKAEIAGDTAKHLRKVLRVEEGQRFEISDNQALYLAEVTGIGKELVEFKIVETLPVTPSPVRLHLLTALVKFDHFEWILGKATELGVERITPIVTTKSEKGLDEAAPKRMTRWNRIIWESGQQARRVVRPHMEEPLEFAKALSMDAQCRLFLDEDRTAKPILNVLPGTRLPGDLVLVLTGPEGGWTDEERKRARDGGWRPASLGPQILRAETAAIAGLAIVSAAWMQSGGE